MIDLPTLLLTALVPALALALLHFLWQGALVGLLAWFVLSLLRNARPQARYAVACMAIMTCTLLPIIDLMLALRGSGPVIAPLNAHGVAAPLAVVSASGMFDAGLLAATSGKGFAWIVAFWAAGASVLSLRMTLGVLWVRRLCGDSISDAGHQLRDCANRLAQSLGIRRAINLRIVETGDSPVSAGWWRPVVLLPAAVVARMPADLLEALLAHELAHIRRHDYLVNLLQSSVEAMLFYHPVVWWLSHRIRVERELVADDLAAEVLGERRRLAIALSELDRIAHTRSSFPHPQLAQAAHGGHLMSRIQQLLRPQRRSIVSALALPVLGLFAAGIAFYAHASYTPGLASSASPTPMSSPSPLPIPMVASGPATAPSAAIEPDALAEGKLVMHRSATNGSYALVRKDREGFAMSGSTDDVDDIRLARRSIDGDFIWLRRDGNAYVIRDATALARAEKAWLATDALEVKMGLLNARMQPHQRKMDALQARMERRQEALEQPNAMDESQREMEAVGRQMTSVGKRQEALARQMADGRHATSGTLERQMDALQREQETLEQQMDQQARMMEKASHDMDRMHAPMEAIGREMEAAARPMEAIGKDMEVLGKQIEREAMVADREVRSAIEAAIQDGLAMPAPGLH